MEGRRLKKNVSQTTGWSRRQVLVASVTLMLGSMLLPGNTEAESGVQPRVGLALGSGGARKRASGRTPR